MSSTPHQNNDSKPMSQERKVFAILLIIGVLTMIAGAAVHNDDLFGVGLFVAGIIFFPFMFGD